MAFKSIIKPISFYANNGITGILIKGLNNEFGCNINILISYL